MKDRTPKFPGRVKLKPVAGQTDTYDMTRADDPDDTGTPFNTRTMLQDSTGRFLRLPYANPLVDDAFRHMVDRIVPIGTIRTSPAQSLGDAWLKCDGSAITYGNYPQLCQLLRNSTEAVSWSSNAFPTSYNINKSSKPVYFDGRWIVAVADESTYVRILSAETPDGEWTLESTVDADTSMNANCILILDIAASTDYCVCAYTRKRTSQTATGNFLSINVCEKGSRSWTHFDLDNNQTHHLNGIAQIDGRFAILDFNDIWYSDIPNGKSRWTKKSIGLKWSSTSDRGQAVSISAVSGKWIVFGSKWESDGSAKFYVYTAPTESLFDFSLVTSFNASKIRRWANSISKVVKMNGVHYAVAVGTSVYPGGGSNTASNFVEILSSTDLEAWSSQVTSATNEQTFSQGSAAAGTSMVLLAAPKKVWTSTMPDAGFVEVTTPNVFVFGLEMQGNIAVASTATGILYYDYTYASKLLPTISLSDDTTTFIKAKNELDVFKSQQSGG